MVNRIEMEKYERLFPEAQELVKSSQTPDLVEVQRILKARGSSGISLSETASLLNLLKAPNETLIEEVKTSAKVLRKKLFSNKLTTMVPIELGSYCTSNCVFCGWKSDNKKIQRLRLSKDGLLDELDYLLGLGFSHFELSGGDDILFLKRDLYEFVRVAKDKIKKVNPAGRLSVCLTPLTELHYGTLAKECGLDTVLTWQESYSEATFNKYMVDGPKRYGIDDGFKMIKDGKGYLDRIASQERAIRSGLQVGIGTMIGLCEDPLSDILSVVSHGKLLLENYPDALPLIIGMPIWREIINEEYDSRSEEQNENQQDLVEFFDYIASVYLLSLPDYKAWVFPNCRVSKSKQMSAIESAGMFTSTMVRVGPGAYNLENLDTKKKFSKSNVGLGELTAEDVLAGEQFVHYFDTHENYLHQFVAGGFEMTSESYFLGEAACKSSS